MIKINSLWSRNKDCFCFIFQLLLCRHLLVSFLNDFCGKTPGKVMINIEWIEELYTFPKDWRDGGHLFIRDPSQNINDQVSKRHWKSVIHASKKLLLPVHYGWKRRMDGNPQRGKRGKSPEPTTKNKVNFTISPSHMFDPLERTKGALLPKSLFVHFRDLARANPQRGLTL